MAIDWTGYQALTLPVAGPLRDASRADAEACFAILCAAIPLRLAMLTAWLADNGHPNILDGAAPARGLGEALLAILRAVDADAFAAEPAWSNLVGDVALWLGEHVRADAPHLAWRLCISHKKATGYQRAVLMGFRAVDDAHYYVDVAHFVATWADLAVRQRAARGDFLEVIASTTRRDA